MTTTTVAVERFTVISSKPFDAVLGALKAAVGQPDVAKLLRAPENARSYAEMEKQVQAALGKTGLMLFQEFDLGAFLPKETGLETPKLVRLLIGNPLIMK